MKDKNHKSHGYPQIEFPVAEGPLLGTPVSSNPSIALLQQDVQILQVRVSDVEEEILTLERMIKESVVVLVTALNVAGSIWKGENEQGNNRDNISES